MPREDYFTIAELLEELRNLGTVVEERTLRYWVSRGLLSKPVKKPFRGADGRVAYFSVEVLKSIADILRLQHEGWKLEQIGQQLRSQKNGRPKKSFLQDSSIFAQRYLQEFLRGNPAKERQEYLASKSPGDIRQIRRVLVGRLERLVGRKEAVLAVSQFLLSLSDRQKKRLIHRLMIQRALEPALKSDSPFLTGAKLRNSMSFKTLVSSVLDWNDLPELDTPPVLGRRIEVLISKIKTNLESMRAGPGIHRRALLHEVNQLLQELEELATQAEKSAVFLSFSENYDTD